MRRLIDNNPNDKTFWDIQYNPNRDYPYRDKNLMYFKYDRVLEMVKNGDKVLDMGCGFGIMAEKVKEAFPDNEVWAFDFSDIIERLEMEMPSIHFTQASIGEENIPNDFDMIIALDVIEHLDDPELVFKDAAKHLKKGGKLVINTPDGDVKPYATSPEHLWLLTHDDIDSFYTKNGFEDVEYLYIPGNEGILFMTAVGTYVGE